jgi:hypothetical protein
MSRREFALCRESSCSGSSLGEEGGDGSDTVTVSGAVGFCSKPKEAMSSTNEGRVFEEDMVEREETKRM